MDKTQLWSVALSELELSLSPGNFATWVAPITAKALDKNQNINILELACPSIFHKNYISDRFLGQIRESLEKATGEECEVRLSVNQEVKNHADENKDDLFSIDVEQMGRSAYEDSVRKAGLNMGLTFESFAVSTSNEVAHAAARTAAKAPGQTYQLIFFYGGVGVGKTHLMQAAGHDILKKNPDTNLVYCTGEEFTNEIIEAIRNKSTPAFRQKYRKARCLLLDDVQFIGGKEAVQEEFFHTFNAVQKEGGQVILTSDRLPAEIVGLEDRLRSRFEGGLTVDIQDPGFELRTAILLIKAQQKGVDIPMKVAQVIAANIESTRQLEGVLLRLANESQTRKEPLTEELASALLNKINGETIQPQNRISSRGVIRQVADYFQLTSGDLRGDRRLKKVALARQVAMYLLRKEIRLPLKEVGQLLGGRDHTTILHGEEKISKLLATSEQLRMDLVTMRKKIYKQSG